MSAQRVDLLAALAVLLAASCSVLVDPRSDKPRCLMSDASTINVCPQGLQCRDGLCQTPCNSAVPDVCNNGIDDDCDGKVDEQDSLGRDTCGDHIDNDCDGKVDEGSDNDDDGWTWCGDTVGPDKKQPDCDDTLASVHPDATEVCDGRDNDCDGIIDEQSPNAPSLCPTGSSCLGQRCVVASCANEGQGTLACGPNQRCDAETGQCVTQECNNVTCGTDEFCDTTTMTCMKRAKQPNGFACADDSDCTSGLCYDTAALRFAHGTRVCGHACCSDAQCNDGERCFASGTGARSCLPSALIPANSPHECATSADCASTEICSLSKDHTLTGPTYIERDDVIASTCRTNLNIGLAPGNSCGSYPECATFTCVPGYPFGSLCSNPCGSSNDCMAVSAAAKSVLIGSDTSSLGAYCRYADVTLDNSPPDYAAICVVRRPGETGPGVYGAECSSASDCLEAGCVGATATTKGHCTSTCCSDDQCGPREDGKPILCRPYAFGSSDVGGARYEMRCDI